MDGVEKLYNYYDILSEAKDKINEHEDKYLEILNAVKGTQNEKRLAAQFIPRFFKHFASLADKAIDAQLDLCEDEDVSIRRHAIKDLPSLCKDAKEFLPKIADALAQLLIADEPPELIVVYSSLITLFKQDAKGTLTGIFSQILNGEEVVRERAIKFLCTKIKTLSSDILTKEVEEFIVQECRKVMQDVTGDEFASIMGLLATLKIVKTIPGQQALVDMASEQAELDKAFEATDPDALPRLIHCIRQAMPFFCPYVSSGKFISYVCLQVIGEGLPEVQEALDVGLELLKLLAEMSPHATKMENIAQCIEIVFNKTLKYLPLPPAEENTENTFESPNLHLSHVECLIYTVHQLGKQHADFLAAPESMERCKDFKLRLQYLARGIQVYIKKLRESLQVAKGDEMKSDENKLKLVALRTTSNINTLIKDLFHIPPSYKSSITLSWRPSQGALSKVALEIPMKTSETVIAGNKRPARTPIVFEGSPKQTKEPIAAPAGPKGGEKGERKIYTPPGGKYSTKVKGFQGRGRGFGYGRSRGRGRGNYY